MYIQKFCNNKEELDQAEKNLIAKHLGKDYCLNIATGGTGGDTLAVAIIQKNHVKISAAKKGKYVGDKNPQSKPITILNLITNEIYTFGCIKDCAEYLQVDTHGTFRTKFLKGLPTIVPQLQNYRVISSDIREVV